jgi:hypothetical protein
MEAGEKRMATGTNELCGMWNKYVKCCKDVGRRAACHSP